MSNIIDFEDYWGPENRIVPESPPPLQHPIPQPTPEIIPPEPEKHFIVSFTTTIQGGDFDKIEIRHDNFLKTHPKIITVKKLTISTVRSKTNETQVSIKKTDKRTGGNSWCYQAIGQDNDDCYHSVSVRLYSSRPNETGERIDLLATYSLPQPGILIDNYLMHPVELDRDKSLIVNFTTPTSGSQYQYTTDIATIAVNIYWSEKPIK
jgi:hypothetical protein